VRGTGLRDAAVPDGPIDVGNAGTLMRLLPGWLAAQEGRAYTLDGDASIRRRPVDRIAEPLRLMGATVDATDGRLPPFTVTGARCARSTTSCRWPARRSSRACCSPAWPPTAPPRSPSRPPAATTPSACSPRAGVTVHRNGRHVTVAGTDELTLEEIVVPGDPSSAAFAIAAGVLVPGSRLVLRGVGVNWTRSGFVRNRAAHGRDRHRRPRDEPGDEWPPPSRSRTST
jgi:3-phosphoshikimate 1-carboxyvinyltransferase